MIKLLNPTIPTKKMYLVVRERLRLSLTVDGGASSTRASACKCCGKSFSARQILLQKWGNMVLVFSDFEATLKNFSHLGLDIYIYIYISVFSKNKFCWSLLKTSKFFLVTRTSKTFKQVCAWFEIRWTLQKGNRMLSTSNPQNVFLQVYGTLQW